MILLKLKGILLTFFIVLFIIIATYSAIVVINNSIADKIEKNLTEFNLPENTELIDSVSLAGKLEGNGNGMQYMGAILVKTELSGQELEEYYAQKFSYIEVREQKTKSIDFTHQGCSFDVDFDLNENYYSIICWDYEKIDFLSPLLDFDLRGH